MSINAYLEISKGSQIKNKYVEVGKIYNKSVALNKIKQYTLTDK